jgi:ribosomal protein L37E
MIDMRQGTCALCGHDEVIEGSARDFFGRYGEQSEPLAVTQAEAPSIGSVRLDPEKRLGQLRQYVCRRCGYTQWFAYRPEEIPIGFPHETRIVKGPPRG